MSSDGPTYESLRAAWEKMKQQPPERPTVVHPDELAVLEEHGFVNAGRIDWAALHAYVRKNASE